jgi:hypothetical protein
VKPTAFSSFHVTSQESSISTADRSFHFISSKCTYLVFKKFQTVQLSNRKWRRRGAKSQWLRWPKRHTLAPYLFQQDTPPSTLQVHGLVGEHQERK